MSATKRKSKEVQRRNSWWCKSCQSEEMTQPEMLKHLSEKHGLKTEGLKCTKTMRAHIDGDTWFSYEWDVTVKNGDSTIRMTNHTTCPRAKDDLMRYA